jgi:rRNA processing protein Gar1
LKLIGEIKNVSYNGLWIIRSDMSLKIGLNVYNQHKKVVGRIVNIIGPVSEPYLLVRPSRVKTIDQLQIIGEKLYINKEVRSKK